VTSEVVYIGGKSSEDLAAYKGQLKGKIVLLSPERPLKPVDKPYMTRESDEDLTKMAAAPQPAAGEEEIPAAALQNFAKGFNDRAKILKFVIDEGAAVAVYNSGNGSGGTIFVDGASVAVELPEIKTIDDFFNSAAFQPQSKKYEANMLPQITMATEDYNRLVRMIKLGSKPKMAIDIDSQDHDEDGMG